jgi:HSP20 family protein
MHTATPSFSHQHAMQQEEVWNQAPSQDAEGQLTIDVYQTDSDIVIKSTIAGVKPEDLDVAINNDMVTIKGERKNEEIVESGNYYYQECYWGSFSRSVLLPVDIISEKAEASLKNGILTIRLPKADTTKIKKIQVRGF